MSKRAIWAAERSQEMKKITLNNGTSIPVLGCGMFRLTDAEEAAAVTKSALENGYRHIDTATVYRNEEAVGLGMKQSGVPREDIFLTTKIWNDMQRKRAVREALENSLRMLDTSYVDLYLIHWPVPAFFAQTWKDMEPLYEEGLARAIGVCNFRIEDLQALEKISGIVPAVNQVEMHPYLQQNELVDYCRDRGIRMESWGTFTAGQTDLLKDPVLIEIAAQYGKSTAQVVLRWNYQRGVVSLVKSAKPERQRQNQDIFDFELSAADMQKIAAMDCGRRLGRDPANSDF